MDGTLGDTVFVSVEAIVRTVHQLTGQQYAHPEIIDRFGPTEPGILRQLLPQEKWEESERLFLAEYESIHQSHKIGAYAGIEEVLHLLKRHHIRQAIVTGKSRESAEISLCYYQLDGFFEAVETGSLTRSIKKDCIQKLVRGWQVPSEQVLYIGDAPSDVTIAKSAGVCPISVAWADTAELSQLEQRQPCAVFERVQDFKTWLVSQLNGHV
jgi:phosphoglycolate phosphatase/pyrophosphatase PpaX